MCLLQLTTSQLCEPNLLSFGSSAENGQIEDTTENGHTEEKSENGPTEEN